MPFGPAVNCGVFTATPSPACSHKLPPVRVMLELSVITFWDANVSEPLPVLVIAAPEFNVRLLIACRVRVLLLA
ncbi:hypothetical protein GCM10007901_06510 [Dyella acidisoli]|uniref:Uncharacterized protein n=1 Tax=Dyella acidisoli TaxID=1867834 RepID=A0ABQ5XMA8_9GAMM|nr:hypothetical protein GCM10007901_06510 [Dyella acidisoli]